MQQNNVTGFGYFIVLYVVFKVGGGALWVQCLYLFLMLFSVFVLRPYLLHREVGFTYNEVFRCIWMCFKPMIVACVVSFGLVLLFSDSFWQQVFLFILTFFVSIVSVWLFMERSMKKYMIEFIKSKLNKRK